MARLVLALALSACYSPDSEPSCAISCETTECPTGYACTADQRCALPGDTCGDIPPNGPA